jgi:hypothetical protein
MTRRTGARLLVVEVGEAECGAGVGDGAEGGRRGEDKCEWVGDE